MTDAEEQLLPPIALPQDMATPGPTDCNPSDPNPTGPKALITNPEAPPSFGASLLSLPNEVLLQILRHLSGVSLASLSQTSHLFHTLTSTPALWSTLLAPLRPSSPAPHETYKSLYATLHPHLHLRPRLYHCDRSVIGALSVTRYHNGHLHLLTLLTPPAPTEITPWSNHPHVLIPSTFTPTATLWTHPILSIPPIPSPRDEYLQYTLHRCVPLPPTSQTPSTALWPPSLLPSPTRTRNLSHDGYLGASHTPRSPATACPNTFRLRRELRWAGDRGQIETWAAVDEAAYTPDALHPLRGVWMGFYAGHGVEVVLFLQPPGTRRLEAVKLTGDENVPRGELTFVVPDLRNIVEVETGKEWGGARVIPASGQVADTQFRNARFIPCNLLWIDNDDVALHWMFPDDDDVGGGSGEFVNRYKRMDVDVLLYGDGPIGENDGSGMELTLA